MAQPQVSTHVKEQTLNPSWSQRFALDRLHPEASKVLNAHFYLCSVVVFGRGSRVSCVLSVFC